MSYRNYQTWRDTAASLEPTLSVVVPAYNEATRIVPTIAAIAAHLSGLDIEFEIIVSDDGSDDGTVELLRDLSLRNLVVLEPGRNRGKGAAVRDGVREARGEYVLFSDADLSTPIEQIDEFLAAAESADVVIGSRAADGADEGTKSRMRTILSNGCRRLTTIGLGLDVADTQCGFKLFTRSAARNLFAAQVTDGFSFDAEILFLAGAFGYRVVELPVRWIDAPGSKVDPLTATMGFLRDLLLIRLRALGRRYPTEPVPVDVDPMRSGLRLGVVTALPPSQATLTEYGQHLVENLSAVPEVRELIVLAEDSDGVPPSEGNVRIVPAWRFNSTLSGLRVLAAVWRERPDAVLFNAHFTSFGRGKLPAALGLCLPAILRQFGVPTVVLLHNLVDTVDLESAGFGRGRVVNRILLAIGRSLTRVLLRADRVVTTVPRYVEILRTSYGADNVSLTPHGSFETPSTRPPSAGGARRVLTFGKFGTYKRVEDLLAAFRQLMETDEFSDVELVIAGTDSPNADGYLASVAESCRDLDAISFTGYVAEEDVADLFSSSSVVVFPYSSTTGSSGPLHQAGAYGRAVVAPRLGDFIDLIDEEGFVVEPFEPGDVDSLADALAAVLRDSDRRAEMGDRNRAAACGLPLSEIAEWHVAHVEAVLAA